MKSSKVIDSFKGYRDILYHPNPEKEVDRLFSIMDYNNDGYIDYTG